MKEEMSNEIQRCSNIGKNKTVIAEKKPEFIASLHA